VDFKYQSPYLDVYVLSSQCVVSGVLDPPADDFRLQLVNVAEPVQHGQLALGNIKLHIGLHFQIGASEFRIEQLLPNDSVLGKSIYGHTKGNEQLFEKAIVTGAILDKLNKYVVNTDLLYNI
jgi:hypothetical protein